MRMCALCEHVPLATPFRSVSVILLCTNLFGSHAHRACCSVHQQRPCSKTSDGVDKLDRSRRFTPDVLDDHRPLPKQIAMSTIFNVPRRLKR